MSDEIEKLVFHTNQTPEQLRELEDCKLKTESSINKRPNSAFDECKLYESTAKKFLHCEHLAEAFYFLGFIYYNLGKNEHALIACNKAETLTKNIELKYKIQICLGAIYTYFGEFSKAIDIYNSSLSTNNSISSCGIYNNIAAIYFKQKEYQYAIDYFNKAIERSTENTDMTLTILNNIGRCYLELSDLSNAESILYKAKEILKQFESPIQGMINNLTLGLLFYKQEKFAESYNNLLDAYVKCKDHNLRNNLYSATIFLANAAFKNNKLDDANVYYLEAIGLVKSIDKRLYNSTLKEYINFIIEQGDFERAISYFLEYDKNREEILVLDKEKEINALKVKFQNNEQKLEIDKLNRENEFQTKLLEQAEDIKRTNEKLVETNQNLSEFSYALSHDIRTPIRQLAGFSSMIRNKDYDGKSDLLKSDLNYIFDAAKKADMMIHDLHQFSVVGIQEEKFTMIDTNETLKDALGNLSQQIIDTNAIINVRHELPFIKGNKTLFTQLFQNLIGNAIKYSQKDIIPTIDIDFYETDGKRIISIQDNGIGIPESDQNEVFKLFGRASNHKEIDGTGIGLAFCYKIVQKTNGSLSFQSEGLNKGTKFEISYS